MALYQSHYAISMMGVSYGLGSMRWSAVSIGSDKSTDT